MQAIMKKLTFALIFLILLLCIMLPFFWINSFKFDNSYKYHNIDIVVVFGAGINKNGTPSPALKYRLDKCISIHNSQGVKFIFISGRKHEVFVMKKYLLYNEIDINKIIDDPDGENTARTIKNLKKFLDNFDQPLSIAFISQKYHLPRIYILAKKYKLKNYFFVPTETKDIHFFLDLWLNLRESLAIYKAIFYD